MQQKLFLALVSLCISAFSFGLDISTDLGLNFSKLVGKDVNTDNIALRAAGDFTIGPDIIFSHVFSLHPEFGFHSKGTKTKNSESNGATTIKFNYYTISVLPTLRVPIADKVDILFYSGPSFNFLNEAEFADSDGNTILNTTDGLNEQDLTFIFGTGVSIPVKRFKIFATVDYNRGFTSSPFADPDVFYFDYPQIFNQSISVYLGFGYGILKHNK
jgi:hypothetical protein